MDGFNEHLDTEKVPEKDISPCTVMIEHEEINHEFNTLRDKLKFIFHSNKFHILIVCFVIIDCILVVSVLLLDLKVIPEAESKSEDHHHRSHVDAHHILHYASLSILGFFVMETLARLVVFRLEFFRSKLEVFDAVVVIVSFILDVIFRDKIESGISLLIVLRLWRVVRILNGVVLTVKIQADKRVHREKKLREECELELVKYREYYSQEEEVQRLKALLRKHGIDYEVSEVQTGDTIDNDLQVNHALDKVVCDKESSPDLQPLM